MTVASTDGAALAVHDLGGSGPALLLSHATGFHGFVLAPLAHHLTDHFHCWALDHRGHGVSTSPTGPDVSWTAYGADTYAVVHALGLRGGIGFGHSMGGTALLMAELASPESFAGLVLYEPIVDAAVAPDTAPRGPDLAEGARRRRAVFASRQEAYDNFAAKPPLDVLAPEALRAYVEHGFVDTADGRVRLACDPEHEARTYETGRSHGTFEHLADITCPVLVLAGIPTGNSPAMVAPLVAQQLAHGRIEVFGDLGHLGPMQDPGRVADIVRRFGECLAAA